MRAVPKQLVTIGPDRTLATFSVSQRWDGSLRVRRSQRDPANLRGRYVLVLDPSIAFRRRCDLPTNAQAAKRIMRQLADELFPFESESTRYAFGERGDATYVFALARAEFEELVAPLSRPPSALLCASAEPEPLERVLSLWTVYGSVCDFQSGPRPLPRALGISALLIAGIIAVGALGGQYLYAKHGAALARVQAEQAEIRRQASELKAQLSVIEHMSAAQRALSTLASHKTDAAISALGQLVNNLPNGAEIASIAYDGDTLLLTGWMPDAAGWLATLQGKAELLEHTQLPERDFFKLKISIATAQ